MQSRGQNRSSPTSQIPLPHTPHTGPHTCSLVTSVTSGGALASSIGSSRQPVTTGVPSSAAHNKHGHIERNILIVITYRRARRRIECSDSIDSVMMR
jgi:hypothetical protein